jgi:TIR domain-containing protein
MSYRREDSAGYAQAIYGRLIQKFSEDRVFMDVDTIEPGVDFVRAIEQAVEKCDLLIALVGKRWLESKGAEGPRLNDPKDFVRIEIATALSRDIRIIPVLLDGTPMPAEDLLPPPLKLFARRNAIEIGNTRFNSDIERLTTAINKFFEEELSAAPSMNVDSSDLQCHENKTVAVPSKPKTGSLIYWAVAALYTFWAIMTAWMGWEARQTSAVVWRTFGFILVVNAMMVLRVPMLNFGMMTPHQRLQYAAGVHLLSFAVPLAVDAVVTSKLTMSVEGMFYLMVLPVVVLLGTSVVVVKNAVRS